MKKLERDEAFGAIELNYLYVISYDAKELVLLFPLHQSNPKQDY